jgi:hypothetical protein
MQTLRRRGNGKNNVLYHYGGCHQGASGGVTYFDGVIEVDRRIARPEDYDAVKRNIASVNHTTVDRLALFTLTELKGGNDG